MGTALPVIVSELQGNDVYVWAFTAYLLTATISGPIYGKLSDIFGRRIIFTIGVSIFLIGSVLCSLSQEMWQFILFRGIQGLGAGALFPVALAIIGDIFAPSERGRYQGFFGAVFGVSTLVGPALGGLITDNFGWHWIFLVNVPIGLVVLVVIWRTLPTRIASDVDRHIDYLGAAVLAVALVPLLIGFTNKQFGEWTDLDVGGLIALGLLLIPVFVLVESRAKEPILPLRLFRIRDFTASVLAFFLAAMGFFAAVVFLPRWFQVVNGNSATESGYQILPLLLGLIVSAIATGQIVSATKRYKALTVTALLVTALGLFLLTNIRPDTPEPHALALDGDHRRGHRPDLRRLHAGGAERRAGALPGHRHEQPDAVPAGGRDDRAGDRRHDLRLGRAGGGAEADGRGGRSGAVRRSVLGRRERLPEQHLPRLATWAPRSCRRCRMQFKVSRRTADPRHGRTRSTSRSRIATGRRSCWASSPRSWRRWWC